ncbi:hypothetical protein FOA24_34945 [Bacillus thuringiensis]|uniref:hypothetical protein n=1 Tax=Bacillus thuringiensis TaxID=1428 RepID=UPI00333C6B87
MNKYNNMCSGSYQNNDKPNCDHYHTYNNNDPSNSKGPYMECGPTPRSSGNLLDINGDPVLTGRDYYLLNRYTANKGGGATQVSWWNAKTDEYLGTQVRGQDPFNTKFMFFRWAHMGYNYTLPLNQQIHIHLPENPNWYAMDCLLGVCLATKTGSHTELWTPMTSSASLPGTFHFQNYNSRQFLGSNGPGEWLYANKSLSGEINFEIVPV